MSTPSPASSQPSNIIKTADQPAKIGTLYPPPFHQNTKNRIKHALGDAAGLDQFGVNFTILKPGCWTALPHWHEKEDEFVYVLKGHPTLIVDGVQEQMSPGDAAGFKAGVQSGHHIENRTQEDVHLLEVGSRKDAEVGHYPGLDLRANMDSDHFFEHLDGTPYPDLKRRGPQDD